MDTVCPSRVSLRVSVLQTEVRVHFEVEFDEQLSFVLLSRKVVDGQSQALGRRANGIEKGFALRRTRLGVDDDVGRHYFSDALFDSVAPGVHLFEAGGARHAHCGIYKIAIARAAQTYPFYRKHAVHLSYGTCDLFL